MTTTPDSLPREAAEVQESITGYWDRRAATYDAHQQRPGRREADRDVWAAVWRAALPPAPADVLDLGTGSGHAAVVQAGLRHRVTGTDLSAPMLALARWHGSTLPRPPRFVRGDAVAPDFPAASFDAVTNRYLMWTLPAPAHALARWRRLLRPGGVLAVVDAPWFPDGVGAPVDGFTDHYHARVVAALPLAEARTIDATVALVEAAGFADVTATPLRQVHALDRELGVAPGHEVRWQYLVTGTA